MTEIILVQAFGPLKTRITQCNFPDFVPKTVDRDILGQRIISSSSRSKSLVHRFSLSRLADILQLRAVCGPLFREFSTNCLSKPSG